MQNSLKFDLDLAILSEHLNMIEPEIHGYAEFSHNNTF
jgi:hypothetical protein